MSLFDMMPVARKPDEPDDLVKIRLSQLRELLEVIVANDIDSAKTWLMAAIRQGREDLRNKQ